MKKREMTIEQLAQMSQNQFLKLATKEDLKALATKEDLKNALIPYATKEDLSSFEEAISKDMHENMGKFLTKADSISGKLDKLLEEGRAGTALYKRHEKRISTLESAAISK